MAGILEITQRFHRFYVCDACGTECYFCVTNSWKSLPAPHGCPYSDGDEMKPNWRELENDKLKGEDDGEDDDARRQNEGI